MRAQGAQSRLLVMLCGGHQGVAKGMGRDYTGHGCLVSFLLLLVAGSAAISFALRAPAGEVDGHDTRALQHYLGHDHPAHGGLHRARTRSIQQLLAGFGGCDRVIAWTIATDSYARI